MLMEQINPFIENLVIEVKSLSNKEVVYNREEVSDINVPTNKLTFKQIKLVENTRSVKLYVVEDLTEKLRQLKLNGLRIYNYISLHLGPNKDYIEIKYDFFKENYGISRASFYNGLNELILANLIIKRKSRKDTYWVNIKYVFQGNRINFVKAIDKNKIKYV